MVLLSYCSVIYKADAIYPSLLLRTEPGYLLATRSAPSIKLSGAEIRGESGIYRWDALAVQRGGTIDRRQAGDKLPEVPPHPQYNYNEGYFARNLSIIQSQMVIFSYRQFHSTSRTSSLTRLALRKEPLFRYRLSRTKRESGWRGRVGHGVYEYPIQFTHY